MKFLRKILYPFSLLYGAITSLRNTLYNKAILKSTSFDIPTIVVGNLSVGGTGKTPQIEYLVTLLKNKYKVAILSRGYKRKSSGFVLAEEGVTAEIIGDEPFQYFRKFKNVQVCVDADRVHGIEQLKKLSSPPDVVLLDDAYQHRKVQGGFNILLTPYNDLYVDDAMLPTGNLREHISGAERAQIIIVTKCPPELSEKEQFKTAQKLHPTVYQTVFFTTIKYDDVLQGPEKITLQELKNYEVLLVTGIANPQPLINLLTTKEIAFKHLQYTDHHNFTEKEIDEIKTAFIALPSNKKIILTTEKDYVRIFANIENLYCITIQTQFINHKNDFDNIINAYVERSSGNS